jgi:hypothetical protein
MANAKQELLEELKEIGNTVRIKCASIEYEEFRFKPIQKTLKVNYSEQEYSKFLDSMDFEYSNSYDTQQLFGTIWLEDGTWLTRSEYDGSEWWFHNILPNIPKECL